MSAIEMVTYYDVRWQCPRCGRFLAEGAVESTDELDPDTYYGVSGRIWATCVRCGRVDDPRCVRVRELSTALVRS